MKRVLFFFLLILSIHFINAQPLSQRLDALLHEEVLKTSEVGIAVFDLTTGKSVYRYQDVKISPFLFIFHHLTYIRKSLYYSAF